MPVMRPFLFTLGLLALLLLGACRETDDPGATVPADPAASDVPPGVVASPAHGEDFELGWLGVLPCADCDGIQTRLLLSRDGDRQHYVLEETYLGGGGEGENRFVQEGDWIEEAGDISGEAAVVYRLDPQGTGRWFWLQPDGALEMLESENQPVGNGIDYRLQRM